MKKFTKLFLSCAAVAALTAAVVTTASAEAVALKGDLVGSYEDGKITITAPADMDTAKEATMLVYDATVTDRTKLAEADIVGIDQSAEGVSFANNGLKGAPTEAGEKQYTVALGYYTADGFKIVTGKLFGSAVEIGNVNGDEAIDPADAVMVVQHFGGVITLTGDEYTAANANGDEAVDPADAVCIVRAFAGLSEGIGNIQLAQN